jgi:hypothetical protein
LSIKIMSWVWENSPYEGSALLIHLALADHANDDGTCWPSQTGIAGKARCSDRYVRQVTSQMIDDGLLQIEVSSNGRTNHRYKVIHRNSVPAEA